MKTCNICHNPKELSEFPIKEYNDGIKKYRSHCKSCHNLIILKRRKRPVPEEFEMLLSSRQRKEANKKILSYLDEYKQTLACLDCGLPFKDQPWLCDFHHRDRSTKKFGISSMRTKILDLNLEVVLEEMAKCDPLCSNCHRHRHHRKTPTLL